MENDNITDLLTQGGIEISGGVDDPELKAKLTVVLRDVAEAHHAEKVRKEQIRAKFNEYRESERIRIGSDVIGSYATRQIRNGNRNLYDAAQLEKSPVDVVALSEEPELRRYFGRAANAKLANELAKTDRLAYDFLKQLAKKTGVI